MYVRTYVVMSYGFKKQQASLHQLASTSRENTSLLHYSPFSQQLRTNKLTTTGGKKVNKKYANYELEIRFKSVTSRNHRI